MPAQQELPVDPPRHRPLTEPHVICDKHWNYRVRGVLKKEAPADWTGEPTYKSRTELLEARRQERLNASMNASQSLVPAYRSKEWGVGTKVNRSMAGAHEWSGEPDVEDGPEAEAEASNQRTRANLLRARKAEEMQRGKAMMEVEASRHAARTREPPASWLRLQSNHPQHATQSQIVQEKRVSDRLKAGLTADHVGTNPARPHEPLGLVAQERPPHAARSELLAERRSDFVRDGEKLLRELEQTHVAPEERVRAREDFFIRFRAAGGEGRSRLQLMEERKREAIESGKKWGEELKPEPPKLCEDDLNFWQTKDRYEHAPPEQSRKRYLAKVLQRHENYNDYEDPKPDPFKREHVLPRKVEVEDVFKRREVPVQRRAEERELVTSIPAIPAPPAAYYHVSAALDEELRRARANKPLRPLTISQFVDQFAREAGGMMRSDGPPPGTAGGVGGAEAAPKRRTAAPAAGEAPKTQSPAASQHLSQHLTGGSDRLAPVAAAAAPAPPPPPPPPPAVREAPPPQPPPRPEPAAPLPPPPAARSLAGWSASEGSSGGSAFRSGVRSGGFQLVADALAA